MKRGFYGLWLAAGDDGVDDTDSDDEEVQAAGAREKVASSPEEAATASPSLRSAKPCTAQERPGSEDRVVGEAGGDRDAAATADAKFEEDEEVGQDDNGQQFPSPSGGLRGGPLPMLVDDNEDASLGTPCRSSMSLALEEMHGEKPYSLG